jgi:iron complex outermembrane receptor protein
MNRSARANTNRQVDRALKALLLSGAACFVIGTAWAADAPAGQVDESKVVDISAAKIAQTKNADKSGDKAAPKKGKKNAEGKKGGAEAAASEDGEGGEGGDKLAKNSAGNRSGNPTGGASSLVVAAGTSPLTNNIRVRGVGANVQTMSVEQDVQVAVDGVVLLRGVERTMSSYADYADLAGGAVLYGPQGTMFSKNAIAGAVNITTLAPTKDLTAKAEVGFGEAGEYHQKGTISGALSDTVAVRLSGFNNNVPGYVHNIMTGKDDNNSNSWGGNTKVVWNAAEKLNLTFSAWYRNDHTTCCIQVPVRITSPLLVGLYAGQGIPGFTAGQSFINPYNKYDTSNGSAFGSQSGLFSVRGDYDLGDAKLTTVTAYQFRMVNNRADRDNIYNTVPIYTGGNGGNFYAMWNDYAVRLRTQQWSQDVRLSSKDKGSRFAYELGFYWYHFDMSQDTGDRAAYCSKGTLGQPCATANTSWKSRQSRADETNEGFATFAELQYALTSDLKVFGGPRVQYEKVEMEGDCALPQKDHPTDKPFGTCTSGYRMADDTSITGDLGLRYDFGWGNTYGKVSRGYKGQAFNMGAKTDYLNQEVVQPEYNLAFELGMAAHTLDNKYSANLVLFQTNFENMQVSASRANPVTGSTDNIVTNAGTARSRGFEVTLRQAPFKGFSINENVTYTDAVFNLIGNSCAISAQAGAKQYATMDAAPAGVCYTLPGDTTVYQNNIGGKFPFSPTWKVSVTPRYQHGIPGTDYRAFIQAAVNYQTKQTFDLAQDPYLFQKAYTVVNTTVGVSDKANRYQVSFSVNNIFDQHFYSNMSRPTLTQTVTNYDNYLAQIPRNASRQFSVRLSANF